MMFHLLLCILSTVFAKNTPHRILGATVIEISEVSATYSGAKFTVSGKAELSDDNSVANTDNSITIPVKVEPEAISDISLTITTKLGLVVSQCQLTKNITVDITVQLALPKAIVSAANALNALVSAAPSGSDLTKVRYCTTTWCFADCF